MGIQATTQTATLWNNLYPISIKIWTPAVDADVTCPMSLNVTVFTLIGNRLCNKKIYITLYLYA